MKNVYLVLAIVGTVVPYVFFIDHFSTAGFGLPAFIAGGFANGAAGGFTADVLISSVAFWVYLGAHKVPNRWVYMLLNIGIGLSCALPLYLYMASRSSAAATAPAGAA
jgi:hypothetical protein